MIPKGRIAASILPGHVRIFWEVGAFTNLRLLGVVVVSIFLQLGLHHIPWSQDLFQIGDLPLADCALALGLGLIPVSILELTKLARRLGRRSRPQEPARATVT